MPAYSLQALRKIREHKKQSAEQQLQSAIYAHQLEQTKLTHIATRLRNTITTRTKRHNNFFHRALVNPTTKTEVSCHIASNHKTMIDEIDLRKMLADQEAMVHSASRTVELAKAAAIDADRNLKVIEKHHAAWQRNIVRAEEIKEEYQNDNQNGVRYLMSRA